MTFIKPMATRQDVGGGGPGLPAFTPESPAYSSSPIRSSPLSNPPLTPGGHPPRRRTSTSTTHKAQPTPIPSKALRRTSLRSPPISFNQHNSPTPHPYTTSGSNATSTPLSRSQPLLGSFSLSLLHSRMSHAHKPHSITPTPTTGFALHIGAVGKGKTCPRELRCPAHEVVPFAATYYDLEDGGRRSQTPWVGTIDVEDHFYSKYTSDTLSLVRSTNDAREERITSPPPFPGYRIAPIGQLQMLIKTPDSAVKVFLLPYDLRSVPPGGRLLARERTFVQRLANTTDTHGTSPSSLRSNLGIREKLRFSVQLQFICVPRKEPTVPSRDSSTTRRPHSRYKVVRDDIDKLADSDLCAYFLARTIKVIFTSTPKEKDEVERTERTDEIILPAEPINGAAKGRTPSASPGVSVGSYRSTSLPVREDWETVCRKWHARRAVESATFPVEPIVPDVASRSSTPPVSLLSSQVLSPPSSRPSVPAESIVSPIALLAPLPALNPSAALLEKAGFRAASPQPPSVRTPPLARYPTRHKLRRGSGSLDERELSERLLAMRLADPEQ